MMKRIQFFAAVAFLLMSCSGASDDDTAQPSVSKELVEVAEEEVNLEVWLERLEVGSRELYSARDAVVAAVGIVQGDVVADLGAGTGLYTLLFAEAAGETGHVYSIDIEPLFLDLINRRVDDLGFGNVTSVLGRDNDVSLQKESVDFVFIADTYHYFSDREAIMRSVYDALKPGGSLIIIDYDLAEAGERPDHASHVRFGRTGVTSEMVYIGFEAAGSVDVPGLKDNYFIRFTKAE